MTSVEKVENVDGRFGRAKLWRLTLKCGHIIAISRRGRQRPPASGPWMWRCLECVAATRKPYIRRPKCVCGTCEFLDCTGRCCVNSALFRDDGKSGNGPECRHCAKGSRS